ncbi:MAG: hypothetical protein MZV65_13900 [Chromatiales bacterium]|nr:hypothetical protein [Chromatiales bacterium]
MLAELTPKPDQVTIAINTNQMNVDRADERRTTVAGTSLAPAGATMPPTAR